MLLLLLCGRLGFTFRVLSLLLSGLSRGTCLLSCCRLWLSFSCGRLFFVFFLQGVLRLCLCVFCLDWSLLLGLLCGGDLGRGVFVLLTRQLSNRLNRCLGRLTHMRCADTVLTAALNIFATFLDRGGGDLIRLGAARHRRFASLAQVNRASGLVRTAVYHSVVVTHRLLRLVSAACISWVA